MSLRLIVSRVVPAALFVWACAKADDSDLVGHAPVPTAGKGGSSATGGTGGSSAAGGTSGRGGTGGTTGGTGGSSGSGGSGGSAGSGRGGAPACGESTDAAIVVHYYVGNSRDSSDQIYFHLFFENNTSEALDLATVTVRYWMTAETDAFDAPVTDHRGPEVSGEHAEYVEDGKYSHLLITFKGLEIPAMNSDLQPTEVQFRIQGRNGALFDQSNDYSFAPTLMSKTPHDKITLYVDGKLAWGREPSGHCPSTGEGGQAGQGGQGAEGGEPGAGGTLAGGQGGEGGA